MNELLDTALAILVVVAAWVYVVTETAPSPIGAIGITAAVGSLLLSARGDR